MGRSLFIGVAGIALAITTLGACGGTNHQVGAAAQGGATTKASLEHWAAVETGAKPGVAAGTTLPSRALGLINSAQRTLAEARRLGARVGGSEVRRQTQALQFEQRNGLALERMPRMAQIRRTLANSKADLSDQEWIVKLAMLDGRIERAHIAQAVPSVTSSEVLAYYRRHQARFHILERREVAIIETPTRPPIQKAKREIESGHDFAAVARRVSLDPRATEGRALDLASDEGAPSLRHAIFSARPRVLVGPRAVEWYYLFEVLHVSPAHELPLAQVRSKVAYAIAAEFACARREASCSPA
jgi:hypothetical protein